MASTNSETCADQGILHADPFTSLQLHFGMLLGVDDLETLAANPRGKARLHQAWLHRKGVVWGLGLELEAARSELKVKPGLALDGCGRELHVDVEQCVNLGKWYEKHRHDAGFDVEVRSSVLVTFDAHVALRFRACLMRAVPAIAATCDKQDVDTAYSRAYELAEVLLLPNSWQPGALPYRRLRLLFGIASPGVDQHGTPLPADVAIVTRRESIRNGAADAQASALLAAFREYAALDASELTPASVPGGNASSFPELEDTFVFLGDVRRITLGRVANEWQLAQGEPAPEIHIEARPTHVATATIQELLSGAGRELPADAGGPRVNPESVQLTGTTLEFDVDRPLLAESVQPGAFSLTTLTPGGWQSIAVDSAALATGTHVTLTLASAPTAGQLVRLVALGVGPTPLLAADPPHVPLAGALGGPPGRAMQGVDFVHMSTA